MELRQLRGVASDDLIHERHELALAADLEQALFLDLLENGQGPACVGPMGSCERF